MIFKSLDHPNIVKLHEVYEDDKWLYFVYDLCGGGKLLTEVAKHKNLKEGDVVNIMKQIFSALQYG